jgi:hypothetical protein
MTEREIQNSLYVYRKGRGDKFFAPNFYFHWETDFLAVTSAFQVYEYEVKISRADFKADLKKNEKHRTYQEGHLVTHIPNRFYYACPEGLLREEEIPSYAGLVWLQPSRRRRGFCIPTEVKKAPSLHRQPATAELIRKIGVSLMYRYWRMRLKKS